MSPINTKLDPFRWSILIRVLNDKERRLAMSRFGQVDLQIWLMEQVEHLRKLKQFNLPFIMGELLNPNT
jgi:hypothetical protein